MQDVKIQTNKQSFTYFPYCDNEKSVEVIGIPTYSIYMKKIFLQPDIDYDGFEVDDIYSLGEFTVEFICGDRTISFSNCNWVSIKEGFDKDSLLISEMEILASEMDCSIT